MVVIILQEVIALIEHRLPTATTNSHSDNMSAILNIVQIGGAFGMTIIFIGTTVLSLKSSQKAKIYGRLRWFAQLVFNIYSLEVAVIPRQSSGNYIAAQIIVLELLLLDIGFLLYEPAGFINILPVIVTNIIFTAQTSYSHCEPFGLLLSRLFDVFQTHEQDLFYAALLGTLIHP